MKTRSSWVLAVGVALSSLVLGAGCEEEEIAAQVPIYKAATEPQPQERGIELAQAEAPAGQPANPPAVPAAPAESSPNVPAARVVGKATPLPTLVMSPALAEVVKLIQAGVSDAVLMAYITNSTNLYHLSSDEIIYLNDLGVSSNLLTALIQRDNSPEALAQKQAAAAAAPLPPGVALTSPATNIYPAKAAPVPWSETEGGAAVAPPTDAQYAETPADSAYVEEPAAVSSVSYFNDYLAPYGNWVEVAGYGRCWQPTVAVINSYWRPYCHGGRWIWSNCGWYWYSDYTWGWGPFHYGRWNHHPGTGWFWVPDTVWAPAWVTWRQTPYYCGWAPLPYGSTYTSGFGLTYHNASVSLSFGFGLGSSCYTFVPWTRFCDRKPYYYHVSPSHAQALYKDSVVVNNYGRGNNNTIVNEGVGLNRVAKSVRGEVTKASIREVPLNPAEARPERLEGDGASLVVVRPSLPRIGGAPSKSTAPAKPAGDSTRTPAVAGPPISGLAGTPGSSAVAPGTPRSAARVGRWPGQAVTPDSEASGKTPETAASRARALEPARSSKLIGVTPARPAPVVSPGGETAAQAGSPNPATEAKASEQSSGSSPFTPAISTGRSRDTVGVVKSTPGRPYFRVYPGGANSSGTSSGPTPQAPAAAESLSGDAAAGSKPVGGYVGRPVSRAQSVRTAPTVYPGGAAGGSGVGRAAPQASTPAAPKAVGRSEMYKVYPDSRPSTPSASQAARPARSEYRPAPAYSVPAPSAPVTRSEPARSSAGPVGRSEPAWSPAPAAPQNYSPPAYSAPARQSAPSVGRAGREFKPGPKK